MLSESESTELLFFLRPDTRPDVKAGATECVLGLSANKSVSLYTFRGPVLSVSCSCLMHSI